MADNKLFYYRGFPLIRSGDKIYYGSAGDAFTTLLTIKDTKRIADKDVPNKIMVQMIPTNMNDKAGMAKARKGEFTGFYEALDTAHIWLSEVLFAE